MDRKHIPTIVVSTGDPAGIGPDVSLALSETSWNARIILVGSIDMLAARAAALRMELDLIPVEDKHPPPPARRGVIHVRNVAPNGKVAIGVANPINADYVLRLIRTSAYGCIEGKYDAMVTAPVNKAMICAKHHNFSGHTEYLAKLSNAHVVMMLATDTLKVALATTHIALREVSAKITRPLLSCSLRLTITELNHICRIIKPRIAVCGLNPHAGEQGNIGSEEVEVITPVINQLQAEGYHIDGPFPADTVFCPQVVENFDLVFAMYHDQGLPAIKQSSFGNVVNVTLGLPYLRLSVDHGTAYDLAATGRARSDSMFKAVQYAISLANTTVAH